MVTATTVNGSAPDDSFADILEELLELVRGNRLVMPGVPEIAMRIRQAVQRDDVNSPAQLATLIADDPVLMAYIIKVSNSVGVRAGREIRHIRDAVIRLGFKLTVTAATSFCIMQMMHLTPEQQGRVRALYRHSMAVSSRCHALAARHAHLQADEALLLGLVHDIGKLAVLQHVRTHREFKEWKPIRIEALMRAAHAPVGAALLENWHFPQELAAAVAAHEDWYRGTPQARPDYADLLIAANFDLYRGSSHPMAALESAPPPAFARLRLLASEPLTAQLRLRGDSAAARLLDGLAEPDQA